MPLQWRHNERDSVSTRKPHHCLFNCLFGRKSKKTSKLRVTGLCAGNSPGAGEFPAQMASNAENVSIWWRHHGQNWIATCYVLATTQFASWQLSNISVIRDENCNGSWSKGIKCRLSSTVYLMLSWKLLRLKSNGNVYTSSCLAKP